MTIRILADDLTGALDAAAPFARPGAPVRLLLGCAKAPAEGGAVTVSSESRDLPGAEAKAAVARAFAALEMAGGGSGGVTGAGAPVWFKKVDSVLRGNSLPDTLETMRLGGFDTCLFAPAFPGMGRRTVGGLHEVAGPDSWAPAPVHDLVAAFAALGVAARPLDPEAPGTGVLIGDAAEQADLTRAAEALRGRDRVLWAGSRGLAEALAGGAAPLRLPRVATVIVGTATAASRAQVETALKAGVFRAGRRLLDPVPVAADPAATLRAIAEAAPGVAAGPGRALMVIGGDTLTALLAAVGAGGLDCLGEVAPGLPLSRIRGGRLDGAELVSKSGGFGDAGLLVRILGEDRV
ncbi:MAG: four-carbon acid sugar kinase family protein [Pseudomonadota bacterium]|nr:four-carbon acid sugar kinase family protein [Pseudomonadota bacterium]MEE3099827.1 four-carbon acid sugar kinase family protein [Pseudomonadota bacterium]